MQPIQGDKLTHQVAAFVANKHLTLQHNRVQMKILSVFGTRPEAIKMASVIKEIESRPDIFGSVCITGQHKDMVHSVLELFNIEPKYNLSVQRRTSALSELTAGILIELDRVLEEDKPDMLLVHGDTSTTMAATLAAFHRKIPVGHVEAGLRTGDLHSPWPEEGNRVVVGSLATLHFAPTETAAANLRAENVPDSSIFVTGNSVIDTLLLAQAKLKNDTAACRAFQERYHFLRPGHPLVLVTAHRRESFGAGFERICAALQQIANAHPEADVIYPVHLNPHVQAPARHHLQGVPNIHLLEPQEYFSFVYLMDRADIILTDSGGIQEEAPSLGKPVLVLRDQTERPEAVLAGTVRLVGTDVGQIVQEVDNLLRSEADRMAMAKRHNPYGDGHAAPRIVDAVAKWLNSRRPL